MTATQRVFLIVFRFGDRFVALFADSVGTCFIGWSLYLIVGNRLGHLPADVDIAALLVLVTTSGAAMTCVRAAWATWRMSR